MPGKNQVNSSISISATCSYSPVSTLGLFSQCFRAESPSPNPAKRMVSINGYVRLNDASVLETCGALLVHIKTSKMSCFLDP